MSSKSRKQSQNQPRKPKHGVDPGEAALQAAAAKAVSPQPHDPLEDFIETPKGKSKLQQYFMIFLLIFLLIVFVVPFALQSAFLGNPGEELLMTWRHPQDGLQELSATEFMNTKRELARFKEMFGQRNVDDLDTARFIILDQVAAEAGIEISDEDIRRRMQSTLEELGGREQYQGLINASFGSVRRFEEMLRRDMRVGRYVTLMGRLGSVPDPADIQSSWDEQHLEYAFDYVEIEVEQLHDEVLATIPADEGEGGLEEWFGELPEWERNAFKDPERFAAELVYYPSGSEVPAALLERFPEPEDADPEARAREYFTAVMVSRFALDVDLEADPTAPRFATFEDVQEEAMLEAPAYFAMQSWSEELRERVTTGEEIDMATEAANLGLAYAPAGETRTREEWTELDELGGLRLASLINRTAAGSITATPAFEKGGMIVARVTEKVEAVMPPFADIRERVADKWAESKASDVAVERLEALRAELVADGSAEEADTGDEDPATDGDDEAADEVAGTVDLVDFQRAAEAAGFTVSRREWLDRRATATDDDDWDTEAHRFIRSRAPLFALEEGELSVPATNSTKTHAYLVRSNGSRKMDIALIKPQEYQNYRTQSAAKGVSRLAGADTGLGSEAELVRNYDMNIIGREAEVFEDEEESPE